MSDIILVKVNNPPTDINPGESAISVDNSGNPQVTDGDLGTTKPFAGAFGANFQIDERTDLDTTTSNSTWKTYLTSNINNIDENNLHRLSINFKWGYASASTDFEARILINGVQYADIIKIEPKDGGSDQRIDGTFLAYLSIARFPDLLSNNQIEFQFKSSNNGTQARVYEAIQEFWRVA